MTFEKNLKTFNFNRDTMNMLVAENTNQSELVEMMNEVDFQVN